MSIDKARDGICKCGRTTTAGSARPRYPTRRRGPAMSIDKAHGPLPRFGTNSMFDCECGWEAPSHGVLVWWMHVEPTVEAALAVASAARDAVAQAEHSTSGALWHYEVEALRAALDALYAKMKETLG